MGHVTICLNADLKHDFPLKNVLTQIEEKKSLKSLYFILYIHRVDNVNTYAISVTDIKRDNKRCILTYLQIQQSRSQILKIISGMTDTYLYT